MMLKRKNKYFEKKKKFCQSTVPFLFCPLFQFETIVQLTLDQHRFELHESTSMQIFFPDKYYSAVRSAVAESTDGEP